MGRWEPDRKRLLQQAALELYAEHGFDQTTAAQIAARAGVTERTFFRHFADKREVLFGGFELLRERLVQGVEQAPDGAGALEAVGCGLRAGADLLGRLPRGHVARRNAVIAANPELSERERAKLADYAVAMAAALRGRGIAEWDATLAAEAGITIVRLAWDRWLEALGERTPEDEEEAQEYSVRTLVELLDAGLARMRAVAAAG